MTGCEKHMLLCNKRYIEDDKSQETEEIKETEKIQEKIEIKKNDMNEVSYADLQKIVFQLVTKVNNQQIKIDKLTDALNIKRKKLNILEWLNENKTSTKSLKKFQNKIKINNSHLEQIFTNGYIQGISNILKNSLINYENSLETGDFMPICAFDQKENVLFAYNTKKKWQIVTEEQFKRLVNIITKKISELFSEWLKSNYDDIDSSDSKDIEMLNNTQRALGLNISQNDLYNKAHREIYKHLKINIKNIVEFEFEF